MPVVYPLTPPASPGFVQFEWSTIVAVGGSLSGFSGSGQDFDWGGDGWAIPRIGLPTLTTAQTGEWESFFDRLRGRSGSFLIGDLQRPQPLGSVLGAPLVDGAGQDGNTVNLRGFDASKAGVLLPGDYFQIGTGLATRLYRATESVDSDAGGLVTVDIFPNLRESPPDGQPLITSNPVGLFKLSQNVIKRALKRPVLARGITFSAQEDVP